MTQTRSTLIRASGGRVRVLRTTFEHGRCWPVRYTVHPDEDMCQRCGCTDVFGCVGGCGWVNKEHTLCSRCFERMLI
jgi:hypothetical protein